jgi:hypothetical protein
MAVRGCVEMGAGADSHVKLRVLVFDEDPVVRAELHVLLERCG